MLNQMDLPYPHSSFDLFRHLRHLPLPVLLHSGGDRQQENARFDVLAAAPEIIFRYREGSLSLESGQGISKISTRDPFSELARRVPLEESPAVAAELPFTGGLLGYFAYETRHPAFQIARGKKGPQLPEILAGLYSWAIIVDHQAKTATLVAQASCSQQTLQDIKALLAGPLAEARPFRLNSAFVSNVSGQRYRRMFERAQHYIHAGDCYQVNLAQCFQANCEGDSFSAFEKLQTLAQAPFAAYLEDADQAVMSFSPERFLQVRNKQVLTQPIKGTRPRSSDKKVDRSLLKELKTSAKDQAENLMIVDLLRNDLGKVCRTGSVQVEALFEAHSFRNVHHLLSSISGELKQAEDVWALLAACFPGGSITGTPKKRAMEIIDELEDTARSVYCGSIAWVDHAGNMDSNIAIRTLVRDGRQLYCWGGGGIVADSQWQQEYQESLDKISLFLDALKTEL
jgi:para-aminobenzoate synthetase component 1